MIATAVAHDQVWAGSGGGRGCRRRRNGAAQEEDLVVAVAVDVGKKDSPRAGRKEFAVTIAEIKLRRRVINKNEKARQLDIGGTRGGDLCCAATIKLANRCIAPGSIQAGALIQGCKNAAIYPVNMKHTLVAGERQLLGALVVDIPGGRPAPTGTCVSRCPAFPPHPIHIAGRPPDDLHLVARLALVGKPDFVAWSARVEITGCHLEYTPRHSGRV
ncbi:MAG: hypothetical protein DCC55_10155 [Chloroflexi bacterium]|nr:MAG: hypothetical protein DCC55_10155 [Chloroflexota bacterium]